MRAIQVEVVLANVLGFVALGAGSPQKGIAVLFYLRRVNRQWNHLISARLPVIYTHMNARCLPPSLGCRIVPYMLDSEHWKTVIKTIRYPFRGELAIEEAIVALDASEQIVPLQEYLETSIKPVPDLDIMQLFLTKLSFGAHDLGTLVLNSVLMCTMVIKAAPMTAPLFVQRFFETPLENYVQPLECFSAIIKLVELKKPPVTFTIPVIGVYHGIMLGTFLAKLPDQCSLEFHHAFDTIHEALATSRSCDCEKAIQTLVKNGITSLLTPENLEVLSGVPFSIESRTAVRALAVNIPETTTLMWKYASECRIRALRLVYIQMLRKECIECPFNEHLPAPEYMRAELEMTVEEIESEWVAKYSQLASPQQIIILQAMNVFEAALLGNGV